MVLADSNEYPALEVVWTMFVFFGLFLFCWMLITIFMDLIRRDDIGGWAKTGWAVFVIFLPILGGCIYMFSQGRGMAERTSRDVSRARANFESDVRSIATTQGGPADQIATARKLLDDGAISHDEYEHLKRNALQETGSAAR